MPRAVLKGQSPNQIAHYIFSKNSLDTLTAHMKKLRKKQLLKRANLQTQQFPIIQNNHEDYVYRLYLP
jgi:phosphoribosylaminoimidazole carboxylase (NCAIR synthetase)